MEKLNLINLSNDDLKKISGGGLYDDADIATGYPGQSLVNFIWSILEGAYQKGVNDNNALGERCY